MPCSASVPVAWGTTMPAAMRANSGLPSHESDGPPAARATPRMTEIPISLQSLKYFGSSWPMNTLRSGEKSMSNAIGFARASFRAVARSSSASRGVIRSFCGTSLVSTGRRSLMSTITMFEASARSCPCRALYAHDSIVLSNDVSWRIRCANSSGSRKTKTLTHLGVSLQIRARLFFMLEARSITTTGGAGARLVDKTDPRSDRASTPFDMSHPTSLTVMTFNIRYDEEADGRHAWPHRRQAVLQTIRAHDPDLLGLQEPDAGQWQDFVAGLPALSAFGLSGAESEDGASHGEIGRASCRGRGGV